jgi:hypothetical protein
VARLLQYHPSVAGRDAVGNEIVALHRVAQHEGIDARIYALNSGSAGGIRIEPLKLLDPAPGDTMLVHFSLGCASFDRLASARCRRLMVYHDVTPPDLLAGSPPAVVEAARQGLRQAGPLAAGMHAVAAHSYSSAASLSAAGGPGCDLLPYLMRRDLLDRPPDQVVLAEAQLQGRTLLAAGRVLPDLAQPLAAGCGRVARRRAGLCRQAQGALRPSRPAARGFHRIHSPGPAQRLVPGVERVHHHERP